VSRFIGRSPRSIYRYESIGLIDKPKRYASKGDREIRFYTYRDVLDLHEAISEIHQGRPRKDGRVVNNSMPDRASLVRMLKERYKIG
jgi:DNA-binding transcriptional MerR regulator